MDWNEQGAKSGLLVAGLGAVLIVIGLVLFFSMFTSTANQMRMPPSLGPYGLQPSPPPIGKGFLGMALFAGGGLLVRLGLGIGVVTNARPIAGWVGGVIRHGQGRVCPHCQRQTPQGRFCSHCGQSLPER